MRSDQKDWDEQLSSICCALRSAVNSSLGTSPYYMTIGHFISSGATYKLLRALNVLEDRSLAFSKEDSLEIVRSRALKVMKNQFENNEKRYNLRSREVSFSEGQEVYRRNFKQSNFAAGYNAKLGPSFVKKKIGQVYYDLEDLQGRYVGRFHAKDIKQ
ncbi:uncharacterized protein LOC122625500 [Drosophila teissieri]|uniref:uncharacterized protein LOC122625500 n=1 Tax=Drosophila teissieri TaxID=7243 RepID=UPI001CBA116A|nr:uncharacterized protein LOC122625500 [Drosophila teissieri]